MASTKSAEVNDWFSHLLKWFYFHTFNNKPLWKRSIQKRREKCPLFQIAKNGIHEILQGHWLISAPFKGIFFCTPLTIKKKGLKKIAKNSQLFQTAKMASTKFPEANDWFSHFLKWFFFHTFANKPFLGIHTFNNKPFVEKKYSKKAGEMSIFLNC